VIGVRNSHVPYNTDLARQSNGRYWVSSNMAALDRPSRFQGIGAYWRMADQTPRFRIVLQARTKPTGMMYTFLVTRADDPHWAVWGGEYSSPEAASEAGEIALQGLRSQQRAIRP
jgi:hypothetical protein